MIRINLLPPEVVAARKKKERQFRFLRILLLTAVLFAVGFNVLFAMTLNVRSDVSAVLQQRSQVETLIEAYKPYQDLQEANNAKIALLVEAMGMQPGWRDILGVIGQEIPANVWLTNLSITSSDNGNLINFRGITYDHPSTAGWLESLEGIAGIENILCQFSAEETVDDRELVRFEVSAVITAGQVYDPLGRDE
jgi:Tfp pilus assembly protein PilN